MSDIEARQVWYEDFLDVGYALGKVVMVYLLFERERKKEIDILWADYVAPFEDDNCKIRFVEDGGSYFFLMYNKSRRAEDVRFGFYKGGLDVKGTYSGFKNGLHHEVLFTYGFSDGEHLRMSDRYKTVRDVKILNRTDVTRNSEVWRVIESRSVGGQPPR